MARQSWRRRRDVWRRTHLHGAAPLLNEMFGRPAIATVCLPVGRRPLRQPRALRDGPAALPLHRRLGRRLRSGVSLRRPGQRHPPGPLDFGVDVEFPEGLHRRDTGRRAGRGRPWTDPLLVGGGRRRGRCAALPEGRSLRRRAGRRRQLRGAHPPFRTSRPRTSGSTTHSSRAIACWGCTRCGR